MATTVCTVLILLSASLSSRDPASALAGSIILLPLFWFPVWWLMGLVVRTWDQLLRGRPPDVRVGRRWQPSSSTRQQLRLDGNARVFSDRGGLLLRKRHWFVASGTPVFEMSGKEWEENSVEQEDEPRYLASYGDRDYWWYQDAFYWTNADYSAEDIKALLFTRQRHSERELEHAHALLTASQSPAQRKRDPHSERCEARSVQA
jgi:hypothetical protein